MADRTCIQKCALHVLKILKICHTRTYLGTRIPFTICLYSVAYICSIIIRNQKAYKKTRHSPTSVRSQEEWQEYKRYRGKRQRVARGKWE